MPDADALEIRIAVGHCNQSKVLAQCRKRRQDVREQLHVVSRPIKHVKSIVHEITGIPYRLSHVLKNRFSQETKVVRLIPVLTHDLFAQRNALFRGKFLRYLRIILAQPGPELRLRPADDRPDFPKRIVEIQCYGANSVQSTIPEK